MSNVQLNQKEKEYIDSNTKALLYPNTTWTPNPNLMNILKRENES